jgi:hypothetical protein
MANRQRSRKKNVIGLSRTLKNLQSAIFMLGFFCTVIGGTHTTLAQSGAPLIWMDSAMVLIGYDAEISISASGELEASTLDLLFSYEKALNIIDIRPVGVVADWEYFTYRILTPNGCGVDCETGLIHLTGIADLPGGIDPGGVFALDGQIAQLRLQTPVKVNYSNQCFHLRWIWNECTDNSLASATGDTTFLAADIETFLPGEDCLDAGGMMVFNPNLGFVDGIICVVGMEDRGDINLNGTPYEIGDAVLLSNYFIYGPEVLHDDIPPDYYDDRVLGSDVNDDGTPLTVADLVYLIRIIAERARPYSH